MHELIDHVVAGVSILAAASLLPNSLVQSLPRQNAVRLQPGQVEAASGERARDACPPLVDVRAVAWTDTVEVAVGPGRPCVALPMAWPSSGVIRDGGDDRRADARVGNVGEADEHHQHATHVEQPAPVAHARRLVQRVELLEEDAAGDAAKRDVRAHH